MSDDGREDGSPDEETDGDSPADHETVPEEERAPLSDLRDRVEARRQGRTARDHDVDVEDDAPLSELARETQSGDESDSSELFEEVEVGEIDSEAVWDAVVEEGAPPEEVLGESAETPPEPTETGDEHVIDKREYCQQCEYFSEPPDVACTHEGTEILEMTDSDCFRVRNCPKVVQTEEGLSSVIETEE